MRGLLGLFPLVSGRRGVTVAEVTQTRDVSQVHFEVCTLVLISFVP